MFRKLAISIASSVLIFQYINFERSYDTTFENYNRMYRVSTISLDKTDQTALSSPFLGATFNSDLPAIEANTQLLSTRSWFDCAIQIDDGSEKQVYNQRNLFFADSSFLSFFSVDLLSGDKNTVLKNPNTVVLSQSAAKLYFGKIEPVGKIIHLKGSMQDKRYTIVGIMADFPKNSHLNPVEILASLSSVSDSPALRNSFLYNYILIAKNHSPRDLVTRFQTFAFGKTKVSDANTRYELQSLKDIYLHSRLTDEIHEPGNPEAIGYLTILAVFILIVAWINNVNLATARASERVKEMAIRKFSGANRRDLILQLLLESIIINLTAVALATVFIKAFSASIYAYIGIQNYLNVFQISPISLIVVITIFFSFALISGFYPAIIISSTPVTSLKGKITLSGSNVNVRKTLVVCQFALCGFFLICVCALNAQFNFMTNQDLKIKISNTLVLKAPSHVDTSYLTSMAGFKKQLVNLAIVNSVTTSSAVPGDAIDWQGDVRQEKDKDLAHNNFTIQVTDHEFVNSYHLKLLAGRNFRATEFPDQLFGTKIESVIINNAGSKSLHFAKPENAIGKIIYWGENRCRIIGVVNDFHQRSLKTAIEPLLFTANNGPVMSIKLTSKAYKDNMAGSIKMIKNSWESFFPDSPFDYYFLEDHFKNQYNAENSTTTFFNLLCILTSLVSCMGLFGLSLHATKQRLKEIGIRKTLGASVSQVTIHLAGDFLKLVVSSSIIALPIAFIFIKIWIKTYAYHISLSLWLFILPTISLFIVALITVSFQSISAARTNPVNVLSVD
ncbi:ABC transporter permease [Dyadobacter diqingensis]|uniref:ABC transporter permease n=1 Tax=Dyadobacter diqingensis TaxID=2938121 RepID=UPI0020C573E0|nr:ABC transporter permease [Dyadobacter diqingensis]